MPGEDKKRDRRIAAPLIILVIFVLLTPVALVIGSLFRVIELKVPGHALLFGRVPAVEKVQFEELPTPNVIWGYYFSSTGIETGDPYLIAWW